MKACSQSYSMMRAGFGRKSAVLSLPNIEALVTGDEQTNSKSLPRIASSNSQR